MARKFWGIFILILTACSPIQAQPTPVPPTSLPIATSSIQPTEAPSPTAAPTLPLAPTALMPEVYCEIAAPTLGVVYPLELLIETKKLVFWTDEEKNNIVRPDGTPIYEDLLTITGNITQQNLRVGEIVVAKDCGYGVAVTKPDGKKVWMKQGDQLSFRPDGLGIGDGYEVVPESKVKGEVRLWIDAAGNQTNVVVDKLGLIVDIFRPGEFAWESDLVAVGGGGGGEVLPAGPNKLEAFLAGKSIESAETVDSQTGLKLTMLVDETEIGDVEFERFDPQLTRVVIKHIAKGMFRPMQTEGDLQRFMDKVAAGEDKLLVSKTMGDLMTGKEEFVKDWEVEELVMVSMGIEPIGFPHFRFDDGGRLDLYSLFKDDRYPGKLFIISSMDVQQTNGKYHPYLARMIMGKLFLILDADERRLDSYSFISNQEKNYRLFGEINPEADKLIHDMLNDLEESVDPFLEMDKAD